MKPVFDTNILIDYLLGSKAAREELARYEHAYISAISWMEVMAGAKDDAEQHALEHFLKRFQVVLVDAAVSALAVACRKTYRLKLPDAIIMATAEHLNVLLITRDTKDFPANHPSIRVPY